MAGKKGMKWKRDRLQKKSMTIRVYEKTFDKIVVLAERRGISPTGIVAEIVESAVWGKY